MTIADQQRIHDLERTVEGLRAELTKAQEVGSEATNRAVRLAQEAHDARQDLLTAQDQLREVEHALDLATPVRRETYRSVRAVNARMSERILMHDDERIVAVTPTDGSRVIVWVEVVRPAPPTQEEADRTPEGERAVTEEVPGASP